VLEQSIELAEEEYIEKTLKNRTERRAFMESDAAAYWKLLLEYNYEIKNIFNKAQATILELLNIPFEDFEKTIVVNMIEDRY